MMSSLTDSRNLVITEFVLPHIVLQPSVPIPTHLSGEIFFYFKKLIKALKIAIAVPLSKVINPKKLETILFKLLLK